MTQINSHVTGVILLQLSNEKIVQTRLCIQMNTLTLDSN